MSRPKKERARSRIGQLHNCALCIEQTGGNYQKTLTWMLEIPENSNTYVLLAGRPRTWFCRQCAEDLFKADAIFRDRNAHLELVEPDWWRDPASDAQREHLAALLENDKTPAALFEEISGQIETATKGQVNQWVGRLTAVHIPADVLRSKPAAAATVH